MTVEVPVFGKMVVPEGTNPDDLMRALGKELGVDISKQYSNFEAFSRGAERGATGTARGFAQVDGYKESAEPIAPVDPLTDATMITPSGVSAEQQRQTDLRKEFEYELAKLQGRSAAAMSGYALGTLADPVNLIGGSANTVRRIVTEGVIAGGVQGFFDPLYGQEDTMANRFIGAGVGATGGAIIGYGLGKAAKKLGWLDDSPKIKLDDELATDTLTKAVDDEINSPLSTKKAEVSPEPTPPTAPAAEALPQATPSTSTVGAPSDVPQFLQGYDQTLPQALAKATPRYGRDVVGFESDLDRALYIVRDGANRSKADQQYMDWIKSVTGIEDEAVIRQLGNNVKEHVKNTPDKGVIPPSNIELPNLPPKTGIAAPTAPFAGTTERLGVSFDPNASAWVGLDNQSKNLYNIGRRFLEFDTTGIKPRLSALEQKQAFDAVKAIDPNFTAKEMPDLFRGYAKVLDNLYELRGKDYSMPSLEQLVKNRISHEDFTDLFNRGVFDGCEL